jgi:hypothetical protein
MMACNIITISRNTTDNRAEGATAGGNYPESESKTTFFQSGAPKCRTLR